MTIKHYILICGSFFVPLVFFLLFWGWDAFLLKIHNKIILIELFFLSFFVMWIVRVLVGIYVTILWMPLSAKW